MMICRCVSIGLLAIAALPSMTLGQDELPSVQSALEEFEVNAEDATVHHRYPSAQYRTAAWVAETIMHADRYSPARVDSILDGLQELASTAPGVNTRRLATTWLYLAGGRDFALTGVVRRLEEVYRSYPWTLIIQGMAQQAEVNEALRFLRDVVAEGDRTESFTAMGVLSTMGAPGRGVLRELHDTGAVTGFARAEVARLLNQGSPPGR